MIYADNAATSYPKPEQVIKSVELALKQPIGNPGRGFHAFANSATKTVHQAREVISKFFNIKTPSQLVFTKNATEALNIGIFGTLKQNDHVITTSMEHNSVLRPLNYLANEGIIKLSLIWGNKKGQICFDDIKKQITPATSLIAVTFSSNVTGSVNPVYEIGRLCREKGILFLLDASQGAGSTSLDVEKLNADIMAFPGHKSLLGPQGTGGLYIREGTNINPMLMGGTGSLSESLVQPDFMPDRFESGTLNLPGIIGLKAGVEFINQVGIEKIKNHKDILVNHFIKGLQNIKGIKIFSPDQIEGNTGIVSILIENTDSNELSLILDNYYNIRTRSGFHCAPLAHKTLDTSKTGVVRFSFGYFNTLNDIDFCLYSLDEISKKLFYTI